MKCLVTLLMLVAVLYTGGCMKSDRPPPALAPPAQTAGGAVASKPLPPALPAPQSEAKPAAPVPPLPQVAQHKQAADERLEDKRVVAEKRAVAEKYQAEEKLAAEKQAAHQRPDDKRAEAVERLKQAAGILPQFPWPPPEPSTFVTLDNALFSANGEPPTTLGAVNNRLQKALNQSGYEYSYYRAPNGFALVARMERIRDDGTPQPEEFRFLQPGAREPFSLAAYIGQLFFAPTGLYRMIVFVATDRAIVGRSKPLDPKAAAALLQQGGNELTSDLESLRWSANHSVTALIYEFQKSARDSEPQAVRPSRLGGHLHLERARIRPALASPP